MVNNCKGTKQKDDVYSDARIDALLANWRGKAYPVFVYGTLMQGERASHMLDESVFVGEFLLKDYAMYNLGRYPGIQPCDGETVFGEVYFVDAETRMELDRYEEEGSLYDRRTVTVFAEKRTMCAEAYIYRGSVLGKELMRRPWNAEGCDFVL